MYIDLFQSNSFDIKNTLYILAVARTRVAVEGELLGTVLIADAQV